MQNKVIPILFIIDLINVLESIKLNSIMNFPFIIIIFIIKYTKLTCVVILYFLQYIYEKLKIFIQIKWSLRLTLVIHAFDI